MEIILIQDVATLGYKGDIIKVRPGYGRNFLIPKGTCFIVFPYDPVSVVY